MSGAGSSSPAAAASTIDGEHAGVLQCCYGGRAMLGGQWLENTNSAAYPHARFLDSCVTKQGGGAKFARDYQDWRTIPVEGGESFVVNSSARHCNRCRKKIRHAVTAVDTGGVGAAVDASAGGGRDTDAVHDLARATSDVLGLQLLQRNMSLQRALKQSRKELDRHVCVYMTSYALLPSFSLSPSVLFRSVLCVRAPQYVTPTRVLSFCISHARVPCAYHAYPQAYPQATSFVSTQ
jgi:hypothetical protein